LQENRQSITFGHQQIHLQTRYSYINELNGYVNNVKWLEIATRA